MSNFLIKNLVTKNDVQSMLKIDKQVYKNENNVPEDIVMSWYTKNPKIYTAIFDKTKLIGYINFMPITKDCYERYLFDDFCENNIVNDDIVVFEPNKQYYTLFSSVAIHPKYQNTSAFTQLITNFYRNMKEYFIKNKITIISTIAECVNENMEKFLINSQFKKIKKNIYEGKIF